MTANPDNAPPWGFYTPAGKKELLCRLVRLGLGHGRVKKWIQRMWLSGQDRAPADILYHGLKYRLYPGDNVVESKMLFGSASRDSEELAILDDYLASGGTFVDIGANIGYYALSMAARGAGRVLAIEPNPIVYPRLLFNIRANEMERCITPLPLALGDSTGEVSLTIAAGDMGGSRIGDDSLAGQAVNVPMTTLAKLLSEQDVQAVDAIKIDVEGLEDAVLCPFLDSAPRALWPRLVVMEHTSQRHWKTDILSLMQHSGYRILTQNRSNTMLALET